MTTTSQFADMTSSLIFFNVSFANFSYWSKFDANITAGSRVMAIFLYKELTRNLEIGNTRVYFLPNIWRLVRVRDTKYVTNISDEMLLNAAKCQGYSLYGF